MPVYPFANQSVLALLLALLSATAPAAERAENLLKKSAIYCPYENRGVLEEIAKADTYEALSKLITRAVLAKKCATNSKQPRLIANPQAMSADDRPYYCYSEYALNKPDEYKFCTLEIFITTPGEEVKARSGAYTLGMEDDDAFWVDCKEGGQLLFQHKDGKWTRFTFGIFLGIRTRNAAHAGPGEATLSGAKVGPDEIVKGCKGIDYLN